MTPEVDALLEEWAGVDVLTLLHATRWGVDFEAQSYRIQNDQQFAMEMRLCKEWRIPHSQFLSWNVEDQAKALAHMAHEAQRCASCGIHPTDWPDPDEPTFTAAVQVCPGCAEMDRWQRWAKGRAEDEKSSDAFDGVKPYLKRVGG